MLWERERKKKWACDWHCGSLSKSHWPFSPVCYTVALIAEVEVIMRSIRLLLISNRFVLFFFSLESLSLEHFVSIFLLLICGAVVWRFTCCRIENTHSVSRSGRWQQRVTSQRRCTWLQLSRMQMLFMEIHGNVSLAPAVNEQKEKKIVPDLASCFFSEQKRFRNQFLENCARARQIKAKVVNALALWITSHSGRFTHKGWRKKALNVLDTFRTNHNVTSLSNSEAHTVAVRSRKWVESRIIIDPFRRPKQFRFGLSRCSIVRQVSARLGNDNKAHSFAHFVSPADSHNAHIGGRGNRAFVHKNMQSVIIITSRNQTIEKIIPRTAFGLAFDWRTNKRSKPNEKRIEGKSHWSL